MFGKGLVRPQSSSIQKLLLQSPKIIPFKKPTKSKHYCFGMYRPMWNGVTSVRQLKSVICQLKSSLSIWCFASYIVKWCSIYSVKRVEHWPSAVTGEGIYARLAWPLLNDTVVMMSMTGVAKSSRFTLIKRYYKCFGTQHLSYIKTSTFQWKLKSLIKMFLGFW